MALVPEGGNWRDLPPDVQEVVMGGAFQSGGGRTGYFRRLDSRTPAPTIMGSPSQKSTLLWHPIENRPISVEEAAVLQSYPMEGYPLTEPTEAVPGDSSWVYRRPSPTIVGSFRPDVVAAPGYRKPGDPPRQKTPGSVIVTEQEAATLQSYPTTLPGEQNMTNLIALDLFAGTGWGVACRWLGIEEYGVDNMKEVIATREANGMPTIFHDVWDGILYDEEELPRVKGNPRDILNSYNLLIASPPCQTFSMAGKGEGRKALDQVMAAIQAGRYKDAEDLYKLGNETDPRTALVLTPLTYAYCHRPTYVVLEQVPTVLPVWEAVAGELEKLGYSTVTGILNSEQYGVPQTRKRAILIARKDGKEAVMPTPTHSKYYNRDPKRLDEGVLPWVSMAEALGWTSEGGDWEFAGAGATAQDTSGQRRRQHDEPAHTVTGKETAVFVLRSNYGTGGDPANRGERGMDQPAPTITSKADRNKFVEVSSQSVSGGPRAERPVDEPAFTVTQNSDRVKFEDREKEETRRLTRDDAATLQSYPSGWGFTGRPAPTQTGHGLATRQASGQQNIYREAIANGEFEFKQPFEGEEDARLSDDKISLSRAFHGDAINMDAEEQARIQSYPPLEWRGSKSKQFLMIGNAVPPLLARAILETLIDRDTLVD